MRCRSVRDVDLHGRRRHRRGPRAATAEAGKIWIVRNASWARLYLNELCNFPKSEFGDQVDRTTQFINWVNQSGLWLPSYYESENEEDRKYRIEHGMSVRYTMPGDLSPGYTSVRTPTAVRSYCPML